MGTNVLAMSIAEAGKLLEPFAADAQADPNVIAALDDLKKAAASLKLAIPSIATGLADKLINAGLSAIPVAGPMLASLAAPEIDAVANAVLAALYAKFGWEAPAPVTSSGNAVVPSASDQTAKTAAVAGVADLPH